MPDNKLFNPGQRAQLQKALSGLNREQLLWLGGYITAAIDFAPPGSGTVADPVASPESTTRQDYTAGVNGGASLTILYGTHSGNSHKVAAVAQQEAERKGIETRVISMDDYNARFLKNEKQLLVIVSTHGEGEPPMAAQELYDALSGKKAPDLPGIPFAVIALGDSSYKKYCQTGVDFHDLLKSKGGRALSEVTMLDTDFINHLPELIPSLANLFAVNGNHTPGKSSQGQQPVVSPDIVHSDSPVEAPVIEKVQLNGRGSEKETWHIEISTENKGLVYQPGDSLEVFANNDPQLVKAIIEKLGLNASETIRLDNVQVTLEEALLNHFELTIVTSRVIKKYATFLSDSSINKLLDDAENLESFLEGADMLDLLSKYPVKLTPEELLSVLRRLPPRAYSIASSPEEVGDEVHLTVCAVRYEKEERQRGGVCSTFIADRLEEDQKIKVRVRPNNQFRLPASGEVPIIMVGAGTGVAPFRGFLQHRSARGEKGKNWLIFGDRNFTTDFLYQAEWLKYKKTGLLTRLDVAFSRDQEEKRYVQHRVKRNGKELFRWIEEGAHFYVCGDMKKMARDVKDTFLDILQIEGNLSREESENYLNKIRKEGRYQEDVY